MLVQDWMTSIVATIEDDDSIMKASKLMKQNRIQHLPVLKEGRLVGIISDRDLKEAQPSKATSLDIHELYYLMEEIKIKSIRSSQLITIAPEATLEKAAALMQKYNISALPVVDAKGELQGIITKGDVFRAFVDISGIHHSELQMGFEVDDRPGSIGEVANIVRTHGGRIVGIFTEYGRAPAGFRHVYIRVKGVKDVDEEDMVKDFMVEEIKRKCKLLYRCHDRVD
ncbi:MAG: CBS domain-containing protein [Deltaproteobacteria bacterium]|nr:CBS domain-containing protein [Deltaproteobacteria bacterium]